jgi:S-DNA-T family DNA segregation ATPase FtsK/SpoIIIE
VALTGGRRSPLRGTGGWVDPDDLPGTLEALAAAAEPRVLLVDDAEQLDDPCGSLANLLTLSPPGLHVVASARADALHSAYGHWTRLVRASRAGLLLRPDADLDGELLGTTLPRRAPVVLGPGRGYLVHDGQCDVVQVAQAVDNPAGCGGPGPTARLLPSVGPTPTDSRSRP